MASYPVVLRHATPRSRLRSILSAGLWPTFARSTCKVVWLHTPCRSAWALPHVASRHGCALADVALITLAVPRSWLRRNRRGVWVCDRVVPPSCIVSVNPRASVAAA
jgi:hypothetical protein